MSDSTENLKAATKSVVTEFLAKPVSLKVTLIVGAASFLAGLIVMAIL